MNALLSVPVFLTPFTVHDDVAIDALFGDAGADWFFAALSGPIKDKLTGNGAGEVVTEV